MKLKGIENGQMLIHEDKCYSCSNCLWKGIIKYHFCPNFGFPMDEVALKILKERAEKAEKETTFEDILFK